MSNTKSKTITNETLTTQSQSPEKLLVEGFIHAAEKLLQNYFVPESVIDLCFLFYSTNAILFVQYYRNYRGYGVTSYGIINLTTKHISKLIAPNKMTLNRYLSKISPVFIANIGNCLYNLSNTVTQKLNLTFGDNSYDGFVGIAVRNISIDTSVYAYYPMIMIYEPKHDITNLKVFISDNKCPKFGSKSGHSGVDYSLLYCGSEYGVIFIVNRLYLYQLKLQCIYNNDFKFELYDIMPNKFTQYLYLENLQQIFAIKFGSSRYHKCSLYDLNTKGGKEIAMYDMMERDSNICSNCSICYDGTNMVYIATNRGYIGRYDVEKDEWKNIYSVWTDHGKQYPFMRKFHKCKIWIDRNNSNILHCAMKIDNYNVEIRDMEITNLNETKSWTEATRYTIDHDNNKKFTISIFT